MEVKVIEPIKNYIKEFNTPVEFNLWYAKHKDEVDALTTHKLNKMYHIEGYRITKIKGELMLKVDKHIKEKVENEERTPKGTAASGYEEGINEEINELGNEIKNIKDTLNKLIEFVNNTLKPMEQ